MIIYQAFVNKTYYEYPNEDFCYFSKFPHSRLVLPILKPTFKSECSCTELFLIQYSFNYYISMQAYLRQVPTTYPFIEYYHETIFENKFSKCILDDNSFKVKLAKCNFKKMLNNCNSKSIKSNDNHTKFQIYFYDWHEISTYTEYLLQNYIIYVFVSISILINGLTIVNLSFNDDCLNEKMHIYLKINSYFNLFYSLILLISLIYNKYCNLNCDTIFKQYFDLVLIKLMGSLMKTCSNLAFASFTLSRYIKITKNNRNCLFNQFEKIKIKSYLIIILVLSILLNIFQYFKYKIRLNDDMNLNVFQMNTIEVQDAILNKQDPINDYKSIFNSKTEYLILNVFQYFKIIIEDLFIITFVIIIDVYLFFFVQKQMKLKNRLTIESLVANQLQLVNYKNIRKKNSSHKRISKMIILNGVNYFLFRFPFSLISFYSFVFRYDREQRKHLPDLNSFLICKLYRFCASLQEILFCFYLFSFFVQFLIFYKLDKNFNIGLKSFFRKNKINPPQSS